MPADKIFKYVKGHEPKQLKEGKLVLFLSSSHESKSDQRQEFNLEIISGLDRLKEASLVVGEYNNEDDYALLIFKEERGLLDNIRQRLREHVKTVDLSDYCEAVLLGKAVPCYELIGKAGKGILGRKYIQQAEPVEATTA